LKFFSQASCQRPSTVIFALDPAPCGSPIFPEASCPAQIEIALRGSLSGCGIYIYSPSFGIGLKMCQFIIFLNCLRGFCSLILANTKSHPFLWQIYLKAEHTSFFYTGSFCAANRSYLAPITVIGTIEMFSCCFSLYAVTLLQ
jgi:hypothetical protein